MLPSERHSHRLDLINCHIIEIYGEKKKKLEIRKILEKLMTSGI